MGKIFSCESKHYKFPEDEASTSARQRTTAINNITDSSVSKYYKCPEETLTPVMQRKTAIRDVPVIKDIACIPDPTWTEVRDTNGVWRCYQITTQSTASK